MSGSDWRLQPLRGFWQGVNWDNRPIAPASSNGNGASNNGKSPTALSFLMSVREYFRAISWTGIPEIAASSAEPKQGLAIVDENNETLEDLLDDISKFF